MKRLFLLLIFMFAVPLVVFAAEVGERASQEEIETTKKNAETEQSNLKKEQENLQKLMAEQQEEVNKVPQDQEEQKEQETEKLNEIQAMNKGLQSRVDSLSEYLNKVADKKEITQDDIRETNQDVKDAQGAVELSEKLRTEFVPAQTSESQTEQEAQADVKKLSLWDTFKLNVQSAFAQTKAALASFFGNKKAQIAAHQDLVAIYDQLKDYANKAKSQGKLAVLYTQLENLDNAIAAQAQQVDTLNNPEITLDQKISVISETVADAFTLKDTIWKNQDLSAEARQPIENIDAKVDDFLGELDFKISKVSAYEILGANPTDTVKEIKEKYDFLVAVYTPKPEDSPEEKQRFQETLSDANNAMKELFGSDYLNNPDLEVRAVYDKLPIVQQRFEIKEMTAGEKEAFDKQKERKAVLTETDILTGQ